MTLPQFLEDERNLDNAMLLKAQSMISDSMSKNITLSFKTFVCHTYRCNRTCRTVRPMSSHIGQNKSQNAMQKTTRTMIRAPKLCRVDFSALDFEELAAEGELLVLVPLAPDED